MILECIKMDIFFFIDDFVSVFNVGFIYVKSVVKKLVDCLMIGWNEIRVVLMIFGLIVFIWFNFGLYID